MGNRQHGDSRHSAFKIWIKCSPTALWRGETCTSCSQLFKMAGARWLLLGYRTMARLHACSLSRFSHIWLFVTPWIIAHQAPLSMGFSRQEYFSGLPCPPQLIMKEMQKLKSQWDIILHLLKWLFSKREEIINVGKNWRKENIYTLLVGM